MQATFLASKLRVELKIFLHVLATSICAAEPENKGTHYPIPLTTNFISQLQCQLLLYLDIQSDIPSATFGDLYIYAIQTQC